MVLLKIKGLVFYIGMVICRHVQKINQNTVGLLICKNTCRKGLFNSGLILQQAFLGHKKLPHPYFFFSFCVYNPTKRSCNRIAHEKREKKRRYRVKTCGLNTSIKVTSKSCIRIGNLMIYREKNISYKLDDILLHAGHLPRIRVLSGNAESSALSAMGESCRPWFMLRLQ